MPGFPDLPERLGDGGVELRLSSEWDIPDILIAHQDDPELHRRLGLARPPSGAELGRDAERAPAERATGSRIEFTVVDPGDDTCRGRLVVHRVDWPERRAELGLWLVPQRRGQGLGARVLYLGARWLLGPGGLDRLTVVTSPENQAMVRAARRVGFIQDGDVAEPVSLSLTAERLQPSRPTS